MPPRKLSLRLGRPGSRGLSKAVIPFRLSRKKRVLLILAGCARPSYGRLVYRRKPFAATPAKMGSG